MYNKISGPKCQVSGCNDLGSCGRLIGSDFTYMSSHLKVSVVTSYGQKLSDTARALVNQGKPGGPTKTNEKAPNQGYIRLCKVDGVVLL